MAQNPNTATKTLTGYTQFQQVADQTDLRTLPLEQQRAVLRQNAPQLGPEQTEYNLNRYNADVSGNQVPWGLGNLWQSLAKGAGEAAKGVPAMPGMAYNALRNENEDYAYNQTHQYQLPGSIDKNNRLALPDLMRRGAIDSLGGSIEGIKDFWPYLKDTFLGVDHQSNVSRVFNPQLTPQEQARYPATNFISGLAGDPTSYVEIGLAVKAARAAKAATLAGKLAKGATAAKRGGLAAKLLELSKDTALNTAGGFVMQTGNSKDRVESAGADLLLGTGATVAGAAVGAGPRGIAQAAQNVTRSVKAIPETSRIIWEKTVGAKLQLPEGADTSGLPQAQQQWLAASVPGRGNVSNGGQYGAQNGVLPGKPAPAGLPDARTAIEQQQQQAQADEQAQQQQALDDLPAQLEEAKGLATEGRLNRVAMMEGEWRTESKNKANPPEVKAAYADALDLLAQHKLATKQAAKATPTIKESSTVQDGVTESEASQLDTAPTEATDPDAIAQAQEMEAETSRRIQAQIARPLGTPVKPELVAVPKEKISPVKLGAVLQEQFGTRTHPRPAGEQLAYEVLEQAGYPVRRISKDKVQRSQGIEFSATLPGGIGTVRFGEGDTIAGLMTRIQATKPGTKPYQALASKIINTDPQLGLLNDFLTQNSSDGNDVDTGMSNDLAYGFMEEVSAGAVNKESAQYGLEQAANKARVMTVFRDLDSVTTPQQFEAVYPQATALLADDALADYHDDLNTALDEADAWVGEFEGAKAQQPAAAPKSLVDQILTPEQRAKVAEAQAKLVEARQRFAQATGLQDTADIDTPERIAERVDIIEALYGDGAKRKERRLDLVLGAPASGKSTVADPLRQQHGAIEVDSDAAKALLQGYENGIGADLVHKESSQIADDLAKKALAAGDNIVWPVVGKTYEGVVEKINKARAAGYKVYISHVEVAPAETIKRALARFETTGRLVPLDYIESVGSQPKQNFARIEMEGLADGYTEWDNNQPNGQPPTVIRETAPNANGDMGRGGSRDIAQQGAKSGSDGEAAARAGSSTQESESLAPPTGLTYAQRRPNALKSGEITTREPQSATETQQLEALATKGWSKRKDGDWLHVEKAGDNAFVASIHANKTEGFSGKAALKEALANRPDPMSKGVSHNTSSAHARVHDTVVRVAGYPDIETAARKYAESGFDVRNLGAADKIKFESIPPHTRQVLSTVVDWESGIGTQRNPDSEWEQGKQGILTHDGLKAKYWKHLTPAQRQWVNQIEEALRRNRGLTYDYAANKTGATSARNAVQRDRVSPLYFKDTGSGPAVLVYNQQGDVSMHLLGMTNEQLAALPGNSAAQLTLQGVDANNNIDLSRILTKPELTDVAVTKGPYPNVYNQSTYDVSEWLDLGEKGRAEGITTVEAQQVLARAKAIKKILPDQLKERLKTDPSIETVRALREHLVNQQTDSQVLAAYDAMMSKASNKTKMTALEAQKMRALLTQEKNYNALAQLCQLFGLKV